jgi:hypothetical protein
MVLKGQNNRKFEYIYTNNSIRKRQKQDKMERLIQEIKDDDAFKEKVKELYIQHQIEKKMKEKETQMISLMDMLPQDVEQKIMDHKYQADIKYFRDVYTKQFTIKTFKEFIKHTPIDYIPNDFMEDRGYILAGLINQKPYLKDEDFDKMGKIQFNKSLTAQSKMMKYWATCKDGDYKITEQYIKDYIINQKITKSKMKSVWVDKMMTKLKSKGFIEGEWVYSKRSGYFLYIYGIENGDICMIRQKSILYGGNCVIQDGDHKHTAYNENTMGKGREYVRKESIEVMYKWKADWYQRAEIWVDPEKDVEGNSDESIIQVVV